jgi:crotonobetainyl-CoA:carnitine CoA-transferase CaiB-like acyl-CoA transferase
MKIAALSGIRVLDLSRVLAGPLCAQYLADMGAEVIKVEDTGQGDESRGWPVLRISEDGDVTSAVYLSANRNKRALSVDLKRPEGRVVLDRLVASADVVIESFAPGVAKRLGVDAQRLCAQHPDLIHCSITGFGTVGPMSHGKGYDLILQAFTGMLSITGEPGSPPARSPFSPVDQGTGLHALIGILAALMQRTKTGRGCSVEASLLDTATGFLGYFLQNLWETGQEPEKVGVGHAGLCPYGIFDTADKQIIIGVANDKLWRSFCEVAGLTGAPELSELSTTAQRVQNRVLTESLVGRVLRTRPRAHWFSALDEVGIPCSPVHSLGEFAEHPHAQASGMLLAYEHPHLGTVRGVSQPLRFDGQRSEVWRHAPAQGEHTEELLEESGFSADEVTALIAQGVVRTAQVRTATT